MFLLGLCRTTRLLDIRDASVRRGLGDPSGQAKAQGSDEIAEIAQTMNSAWV